ncbi:hypothetical protein SAMN05192533_10846 [Mesobacillus persicus]|uniref:Antitoxin VbhA domain-containing protein n=1 Tax=Mesobacillus persicus TaxID=930146 RepID=A0A1H8D3M5_9BACI|nr:antitoxin VbhA family protein [Mesobacillus persicus]SEN01334.1 hypothetical protein SAMN05192533_10846 [Mesobacillus persicus]
MSSNSEDNRRPLANDKMDKISRALANAKASVEFEGALVTKDMEELVRRRLIGELSEAQFLEEALVLSKKPN